MSTYTKDPGAVLDFAFDWSAWLAQSETITGTPVLTVDDGLTLTTQSTSGGKVIAWLADGTVGTTYKVACRITTNQGRTDERTMRVRVADR